MQKGLEALLKYLLGWKQIFVFPSLIQPPNLATFTVTVNSWNQNIFAKILQNLNFSEKQSCTFITF